MNIYSTGSVKCEELTVYYSGSYVKGKEVTIYYSKLELPDWHPTFCKLLISWKIKNDLFFVCWEGLPTEREIDIEYLKELDVFYSPAWKDCKPEENAEELHKRLRDTIQ